MTIFNSYVKLPEGKSTSPHVLNQFNPLVTPDWPWRGQCGVGWRGATYGDDAQRRTVHLRSHGATRVSVTIVTSNYHGFINYH